MPIPRGGYNPSQRHRTRPPSVQTWLADSAPDPLMTVRSPSTGEDVARVAAAAMLDTFEDHTQPSPRSPMARCSSGTDEEWQDQLKSAGVRHSSRAVGNGNGHLQEPATPFQPSRAVTLFTALRTDARHQWASGATDDELSQLTLGVRDLRDAWLEADARCINLEVQLNMTHTEHDELAAADQARRAEATAAAEESARGERAAAAEAAAVAAKAAEIAATEEAELGVAAVAAMELEMKSLRKDVARLEAESEARDRRDNERETELASSRAAVAESERRAAGAEARLLKKEAEVEMIAEQLREAILKQMAASESAMVKARRR